MALQPGPRFQVQQTGDGGSSVPDSGQIGDGDSDGVPSVPAPGQIGDGRPVPVPGQIGDGDGDGDGGVRALT